MRLPISLGETAIRSVPSLYACGRNVLDQISGSSLPADHKTQIQESFKETARNKKMGAISRSHLFGFSWIYWIVTLTVIGSDTWPRLPYTMYG
jgi:hypothetical protein